MPVKPSKHAEKTRAADDEPVPMDPKAASRAIGQHLDKKRTGAFKVNSVPKAARGSSEPEPETRVFAADLPPRLAGTARGSPKTAKAAAGSRPASNAKTDAVPPVTAEPVKARQAPPPPAEEPPEPRRAPAPKAAPPAPAVKQPEARRAPATPAPAPAPEPPPAESETTADSVLAAAAVDNQVLLRLLEDSPRSLVDTWTRVQSGDLPELAVRTSKTEMEFLLQQKAAMD